MPLNRGMKARKIAIDFILPVILSACLLAGLIYRTTPYLSEELSGELSPEAVALFVD